MKDDSLSTVLREAPIPEPIGGYEAARERVLGKVRHAPRRKVKTRLPWLVRPLGATALVAGVVLVCVLAWPEPRASADTLPDDSQMEQFYDHHEANRAAYFETAP